MPAQPERDRVLYFTQLTRLIEGVDLDGLPSSILLFLFALGGVRGSVARTASLLLDKHLLFVGLALDIATISLACSSVGLPAAPHVIIIYDED